MTAYYNEFDPKAAAWLRQLIAAGHIAAGDVDERSIVDVRADDLRGYDQCHFFAGVGGWSVALRLAGWPDTRKVWTGSCPCQPLSSAGQRKGHADERHLWPAFHDLIEQCSPPSVFGEQVASKDGREWFAGVRADLEVLGYAVGGADLCAAGVGSPQIRQRLWWVGHAESQGLQRQRREHSPGSTGSGGFARPSMQTGVPEWNGATISVECSDGARRASAEPGAFPLAYGVPARVGRLRGYGNAIVPQVAAEFVSAYMEAA